MYCKHCGESIEPQIKFCPICGHQVGDNHQATETQKKRRSPVWFKILLSLLIIGLVSAVFTATTSGDLGYTVTDQLTALREGRITEAYYHFTSKTFQEATPLKKFSEFVKAHPAFLESKSVRIIDRDVHDDIGVLDAVITTTLDTEASVQYKLAREGGLWKIVSIKLEIADADVHKEENAAFDPEPIYDPIRDQLKEIKEKNIQGAYEKYSSAAFKKATALKDFESFVNEQPGFHENTSFDIDQLTFNNNIAEVTGALVTNEGKKYPFEYNLVFEGNLWKIVYIHVDNDEKKAPEEDEDKTLQFSNFAIGTSVDNKGSVQTPQKSIQATSKDIYLNINVDHGKAGESVQIVFKHIDGNSAISPVTKRLSKDGVSVLSFVFSSPKAGWPKGNYRLLATSSTGAEGSYDFTIE